MDLVPLHQIDGAPSAPSSFEAFAEDVDWKSLAGARKVLIDNEWLTEKGSSKMCVLSAAVIGYESTNVWLDAKRPKSAPTKFSDLS